MSCSYFVVLPSCCFSIAAQITVGLIAAFGQIMPLGSHYLVLFVDFSHLRLGT
ncbi:hypothetical protein LL295_18565 [Vibrio campbellii]|uniref:hypothetical protein n=1 Tax=Vibrio campbellii TaxID=680 RepID=UPI001D17C71E|nr:hypothetical protein [Vibrio campbellii]MCC4225507.1 hypothetical protein [Vibrio campbellii]